MIDGNDQIVIHPDGTITVRLTTNDVTAILLVDTLREMCNDELK